jgi:hypothetical protein
MASQLKPEPLVIYLYGITESRPPGISELAGVDPSTDVLGIKCEDLYAWASQVPALDFEANLAANMENLDWLAETSVAHQRVVAAIARKTEILPARLGTVFRSKESLCKHLSRRARTLKRDFARIKDADEWGIKVFEADSRLSVRPKVRTGKDYLKAKAALLPKRREKNSQSDGEIANFQRALAALAAETAPGGSVSRAQRGLAFQATLLIKRANRKKLESVLQQFARAWERQLRIECTGPWPPYSFVSRADDGAKAK